MKLQTGDIALYHGTSLFSRLVMRYTKSDVSHSALLVSDNGGFYTKHHAAYGFTIIAPSYVIQPFDIGEPELQYIVRLKYDELFEGDFVRDLALRTVRLRSNKLVGKRYDWSAVIGAGLKGLGPVGRWLNLRMGNDKDRFMCSEAVSWVWRPEGLGIRQKMNRISLFSDDPTKPHDDISPADILDSPFVEVIWERP